MGVEFVASIALGLMAGSFALLAFGGDSLVELLSGFVVLSHLRREASNSELHGRRTELLTSSLLFALIPIIGLGAFYSYISGLRPEGSPVGIVLALGAVIIMPYLWLEKRSIGRDVRSLPLSMDAVESVTCFFMSVALLGGLLAEYLFGFWWADYLASAIILVFVAREAIESYRELHEG
jgi:divalent metal cation (Fe/Co/Zn/Cd) transporter